MKKIIVIYPCGNYTPTSSTINIKIDNQISKKAVFNAQLGNYNRVEPSRATMGSKSVEVWDQEMYETMGQSRLADARAQKNACLNHDTSNKLFWILIPLYRDSLCYGIRFKKVGLGFKMMMGHALTIIIQLRCKLESAMMQHHRSVWNECKNDYYNFIKKTFCSSPSHIVSLQTNTQNANQTLVRILLPTAPRYLWLRPRARSRTRKVTAVEWELVPLPLRCTGRRISLFVSVDFVISYEIHIASYEHGLAQINLLQNVCHDTPSQVRWGPSLTWAILYHKIWENMSCASPFWRSLRSPAIVKGRAMAAHSIYMYLDRFCLRRWRCRRTVPSPSFPQVTRLVAASLRVSCDARYDNKNARNTTQRNAWWVFMILVLSKIQAKPSGLTLKVETFVDLLQMYLALRRHFHTP